MERRLPVLAGLFLLLATSAGAVSFPVDAQSEWTAGTFTDTEASGGVLQVVDTAASGTYTSETFDAGDNYTWDALEVDAALNGGSASVTVEASHDGFATVADTASFTLSGGQESFDLAGLEPARYVRFDYSLSGDVQVDGTNITLADGLHFIIRGDGCQADEREVFSMSDRTNAHAGNPGYYEYSVCSSGLDRVDYDDICTQIESPVLSFFGSGVPQTHVATDPATFDYRLCSRALTVGIRDHCPPTTSTIASVYSLNGSHVAEPGYYDHQLCGAEFRNVTLAMEFHISGSDDVYINTTENPDTGVYTRDRESGFISAEGDNLTAGIVGGQNVLIQTIGYGETGTDHAFNMTQSRSRSISYFVPFTTGDRFDLEDRRVLIVRNEFLNKINPNFAFEFAEELIIRLTVSLERIDLVNNLELTQGFHTLVLENLGPAPDGRTEVRINATQ